MITDPLLLPPVVHPGARRVEFSTRSYVIAHGREPRGRGNWAFCPSSKWNTSSYLDHVKWVPAGLTFAQAKRYVAGHFASIGVSSVTVCT